jgi:hypothetical protein
LTSATITIQNLEKKIFGEPLKRTKITETEEEIIKAISKHRKVFFPVGLMVSCSLKMLTLVILSL